MPATKQNEPLLRVLQPLWSKYETDGPRNWCTDTAAWVWDQLKRTARHTAASAEIVGYHLEDNPTATVGAVEGGHDFLLLGGRYIVDFWQKEVWDSEHPLLLDVIDDFEQVCRLYGNPHHWEPYGIRGELLCRKRLLRNINQKGISNGLHAADRPE